MHLQLLLSGKDVCFLWEKSNWLFFLHNKTVCMQCKGEQLTPPPGWGHWVWLMQAHSCDVFLLISLCNCATGAPLLQQHLLVELGEFFRSCSSVWEIILVPKLETLIHRHENTQTHTESSLSSVFVTTLIDLIQSQAPYSTLTNKGHRF